MFRMDDGNFFAYPNNRTIWYDDAFMEKRLTENPGYKIDQNFYTVENTREEDIVTDDSYMTCLLYTSPSPRDGLLSRMPSSA